MGKILNFTICERPNHSLCMTMSFYDDNYLARSLIGHCYYKLGDKKKAAECYNFVVDAEDRPKNLHLVNIRFGIYNVQINNFQKAKENFLEACLSSPTPRTWLGYGSACFMNQNITDDKEETRHHMDPI
ncbi:cilia- and flagella-associated protein 70-like [Schistocerca piceifrons]|uniref:cilia- and flagella-associated protein 70-like n=1 Tax=Schistocerca piceifrons TaxID=274613 RepID=UPI001F5E8D27|nr:cilia- and flagella-associated protein 70-like [Schistocerca piceifrons]